MRNLILPTPDIETEVRLTAQEAAQVSRHNVQYIRQMCRQRKIRHSRNGPRGHIRIRKSDLLAWMGRNEVSEHRGSL